MKKGFTLVELLAVIAILAVILGLVAIGATSYYNERKIKNDNEIKELAKTSAQAYEEKTSKKISQIVDRNLSNYGECQLNYDVLVDNNLMDRENTDANGDPIYNNNKYIKIQLNGYDYEYTYLEESAGLTDCLSGLQ